MSNELEERKLNLIKVKIIELVLVITSSPLAGHTSNSNPICSNNSFLLGEADAKIICLIL